MKHNIYRMALAVAFTAMAVSASAQHTRSGYFVEDYTYRYQMNPAMGNTRGFVAMPALGGLNVGMHGNLHLNSVLYNVNGRTTTFMNPNISVEEAMGKFKDVNRLGTSENLTLLAVGFKGFHGYNTITVGARVDAEVHIPGSLFSLLKEGVTNKTYDITDVRANAQGYAELALNHSHDINKNLRIGATAKVLIGGGNVAANMHNARLELGQDSWRVQADADIQASVKGLTYDLEYSDRTHKDYVNGVNVDNPGVNGTGFALDLGATYKTPIEGLTATASLLDLGCITWKNNMLASTNGVKTFDTDKYTFPLEDNEDWTFDDEWDRLTDDLASLYELEDMGDQGSRTTALHATMNIGASYELPYYKKLTFGLLNTTRFAGEYTWTDFRLSANVAPCKVFSAGINLGAGTFGTSFGWLINLHAPGFNLFMGMDHTPTKLAKQGVPLSSNADFNLGINFLIK